MELVVHKQTAANFIVCCGKQKSRTSNFVVASQSLTFVFLRMIGRQAVVAAVLPNPEETE